MVYFHGTKLYHTKKPCILAYPVLPEEDRTRHPELYKNGKYQKYRRKNYEAEDGGGDIEEAFELHRVGDLWRGEAFLFFFISSVMDGLLMIGEPMNALFDLYPEITVLQPVPVNRILKC